LSLRLTYWFRVSTESQLSTAFTPGDQAAIQLAQRLLELDIANPSDWQGVDRDPTDYLQATLNRWIDPHGARTIRRRFCLSLTLSHRRETVASLAETLQHGLG